ncbi:MAG: hypothetical protein ACM3XO_25600 [Bacteroidota bacterium]
MSGYKHATVTISQEEYRRLHEADMKKRFREFANLNEQNSTQEQQYLNLIQHLERRETELEEALASVTQNTNQVDLKLLQELKSQNDMCFQSLAAVLQESNSNFDHSLDSLSLEFSHAIQQERERFHFNIQTLIEKQNAYGDLEYAKELAAQEWVNRCLVLSDFINAQYDHERFTPGRLIRSLRGVHFAENNLSEGFPESSIQGAQQTYLELSDLHFELEKITLQWRSAFDTTIAAITQLLQQMESSSMISALGLQGEKLPIDVDLDYWTNGRFSQLVDHSRQLCGYMFQDQNCLTFADIDRIYQQILPVIRESFETIVYDARLNALNSQLRMNIAEQALQALELHGFLLGEAGYSGDDMRAQFDAHLDSPDGSRVDIHVVPAERSSEELSNDLVVITTHPYLKTEHEARLRWDELCQALNQFNLRVSNPEASPATSRSESNTFGSTRSVENKITRSERS